MYTKTDNKLRVMIQYDATIIGTTSIVHKAAIACISFLKANQSEFIVAQNKIIVLIILRHLASKATAVVAVTSFSRAT